MHKERKAKRSIKNNTFIHRKKIPKHTSVQTKRNLTDQILVFSSSTTTSRMCQHKLSNAATLMDPSQVKILWIIKKKF
jgi:hypothetical protein